MQSVEMGVRQAICDSVQVVNHDFARSKLSRRLVDGLASGSCLGKALGISKIIPKGSSYCRIEFSDYILPGLEAAVTLSQETLWITSIALSR
jgi:hypothetical protein